MSAGQGFALHPLAVQDIIDIWELIAEDNPHTKVEMISSFRHAGLKRLYERGDRRRLLAKHVPKITRVLAQLDIATDPDDMDLPGFHLHPLTGNLAGFWSVTIRASWRNVFRFDAHGNATDVDYVDYH